MKLFKVKIGHISQKSHRKSGKLYRGSQEVEKKKTPWALESLMEAGTLPKNELKHEINSIFFTKNTENDQKLGLKHSKMEVC